MTQEIATAPPEMRVNACKTCGGNFVPARPWQEFCGDICRFGYHNRRRAEKQNPPTVAAETAGEMGQQKQNGAHNNPPPSLPQIRLGTKLRKVLEALARGRSLNRFEAERELHDHVLPSTISKIESLGITVARRSEVVPGHAGSRVACARYWLEPDERTKAAVLLGRPA